MGDHLDWKTYNDSLIIAKQEYVEIIVMYSLHYLVVSDILNCQQLIFYYCNTKYFCDYCNYYCNPHTHFLLAKSTIYLEDQICNVNFHI